MWLSISSETLSPFTVENNFFFSLYRTLTETSKRRGVFIDWLWPVASVCYLFYQSVVDTHRKREQTEIATTHLLVLYVAAKAFPSKFQLRFWSSPRGNWPYKPHGAGKLNRSIKSRSFKNFIHKIHSFNSQKLRLQPRMMMVWPGRTEQTMGCIPYIFHYISYVPMLLYVHRQVWACVLSCHQAGKPVWRRYAKINNKLCQCLSLFFSHFEMKMALIFLSSILIRLISLARNFSFSFMLSLTHFVRFITSRTCVYSIHRRLRIWIERGKKLCTIGLFSIYLACFFLAK